MKKFNFHNRGQSLIGIIIVLVVVGLIGGGLYYYLSKQISEVPEITEKPAEEVIAPEEEVVAPLPEEGMPSEEIIIFVVVLLERNVKDRNVKYQTH